MQPLSSLELHPLGDPADHSALPEVVRQRRSPAVRSRERSTMEKYKKANAEHPDAQL